jgi:hypothetical protein
MRKLVSALALTLLATAACGGGTGSAVVINPPAAGSHGHMTVEQATAFLQKAASDLKLAPTRQVKSLEDVLAVIEADEFENFGIAHEFAEKNGTPEGKALLALLEILWAEQQLLIAGIIQLSEDDIESGIRDLRAAIATGDKSQEKKLAELESTKYEAEQAQDALFTLSPLHAEAGAAIAKELAADLPKEWQPLALLALHARLVRDWDNFPKYYDALKKAAPDKPFVGFLEALVAAQRDGDFPKARDLMNKFLVARPAWVRARMHLVLWAETPKDRYTEYQHLKQQSPRHAMVIFAGPLIERAKAARDEREERRLNRANLYL